MKFYILASLIIFIMVISHNIRKSNRLEAKQEQEFWDRERRANQVRRKPLDDLEYIQIPLERLPMQLLADDRDIADCHRIINDLSLCPIVNLTGFSNTDLKLQYGTANITALTEYDQSYTLLVSTLQRWADLLCKAGHEDAVRPILEFAVSTRTDVSRTYDMLAELYLKGHETEKISELLQTAQSLNSLNRDVIIRHLEELTAGPGSD
ncbi:MAG: hypothetical protein NC079_10815 [Clostridium sp.]|nr:hypothetical protein [Acetatifactor muris]MCM1564081.1 hypothetical protein [Clostridium sp.]